jgi:Flp pilus assembly protein TadG
MKPAAPNLFRRFSASTHGLAAVELAAIAPVLIILLLATFDAGNAIVIYMKVRSAAFTLGSITNQYTTSSNGIQSSDMTAITGSSAAVMAPYSSSPVVIKISQIKQTSASAATVSWSYSLNGTAYAQGSSWTSLPSQLTTTNSCNSYPCYLIFAEVSYTFTPSFGSFVTGQLTLNDNLYVTPRSSACIQYLGVPTTC